MRQTILILTAAFSLFASTIFAQDSTNAPKTEIENLEIRTGTVIIKGFGRGGSMTIDSGTISLRFKASSDVSRSDKLYAVVFAFEAEQHHESLIVDYDELSPLIDAMDYLGKINYNVTTMPAFDAYFLTKSGLRISAHSDRRDGGIHFFLQFEDGPKIPLPSDKFTQFQNLVIQSKTQLDGIKDKSSVLQN